MCSDTRKAVTPRAFFVALWLFTAPIAASAQEFKLAPGEGNRVCVAVGESKYAFKFRTESQLYVDYQPKDVARASIVDGSLVASGLKPGQAIVKVSREEFRPGLNRYEEVNTWFIVNVTEKPTTDKCLCEGRGEKQCPGGPVTADAGSTVDDKTQRGIAGVLDPTKPPPRAGVGKDSPLADVGGDPSRGATTSGTSSSPTTTGTASRPKLPFDLPILLPPASRGAAGGGGGTGTTIDKPVGAGTAMARRDTKGKDSPPTEAKGPEPLTASEMVFVDAGKSRTAKFKKRVESVKLLTSDATIATVEYREGFGVTIKGNRPGRVTVTVHGDIVRFEAGPGALEQDIPFIFTYNVIVREAKGEAKKPRPNSFVEEMTLAVGKIYRESFNKKAVVDLRAASTSAATAAVAIADNVLTIKGVTPGFAVVTARFKIADGTGAPEAVIITYRVKVEPQPNFLVREYYALRTRCTELSVKKIETVTLPKCEGKHPACREIALQGLKKVREGQQELNDRYARFQSGRITEDEFFGLTVAGTSKDERLKSIPESLAVLRRECGDSPTVLAEGEAKEAGDESSGSGIGYILNPTDLLDSPGPSAGTDDDLSGGLKPHPFPRGRAGEALVRSGVGSETEIRPVVDGLFSIALSSVLQAGDPTPANAIYVLKQLPANVGDERLRQRFQSEINQQIRILEERRQAGTGGREESRFLELFGGTR